MPPQEEAKVFVRRIAYISLATQGFLATLVICFSAWQLNRCPVVEKQTNGGDVDTASCPARALYSTMLTSTLAYFFPSPLNAIIEGSLLSRNQSPFERPRPTPKGRTLVRKAKEEDKSPTKDLDKG